MSADVYIPIIAQTWMGQADTAGQGWNFPDDIFPIAADQDEEDEDEDPVRMIPVPMAVYTTMAVSVFFCLSSSY